MTKEIINKLDGLYLSDKENIVNKQDEKIANYTLRPIAIINWILSTKNKYETEEQLAVIITKEQQPNKRFIKLIQGSDEDEVRSFTRAIHKGIVGLSENFSKRTF